MGIAALLACIAVSPTGVPQTTRGTAIAYKAVFLHPEGYWTSTAQGSGGGLQVGRAHRANGHQIPVMWRGSPGSVQSLLPDGIESGIVYGTDGVRQGGMIQVVENQSSPKAALWRGSAKSYVDLSEPSWEWSEVFSVDGVDQVGRYVPTFLGRSQAVAWRGTRESRVLLTPSGFRDAIPSDLYAGQAVGGGTTPDSEGHPIYWPTLRADAAILFEPHEFYGLGLLGIGPGQQVGSVSRGFRQPSMATIFRGSPTDYTIIHPIGYELSAAKRTNGKTQVGMAQKGTRREACAWWGTKGSFLSLHSLLPREFVRSEAFDIDDEGTIVGEAWKANYVGPFAVSWQVLGVGRVALKSLSPPGFLGIGISALGFGIGSMQSGEVLVGNGYEPSVGCNEKRDPNQGPFSYVTLVQYMVPSAQYAHTIKRAYSRDRGGGWDFPTDELRAEDKRGLDPSVAASLNGDQFVMTWLHLNLLDATFKAWQRRTVNGLDLLGSYEPVFEPIGDRAWIDIGDKPYYSYASGVGSPSYKFLKGDFVGGAATWPTSVTSTSMAAASGASLVPHPAVAAGRTVGASRFAYVMGLQAVDNNPTHTDNRYLISRSADGGTTWGAGQPFTLATLGDTYDGFVTARDRPMTAYHVTADPPTANVYAFFVKHEAAGFLASGHQNVLYCRASYDDGQTWTGEIRVFPKTTIPDPPNGYGAVPANGSGSTAGFYRMGRVWSCVDGRGHVYVAWMDNRAGGWLPADVAPYEISALGERDKWRVYFSVSTDQGMTWADPVAVTTANSMGGFGRPNINDSAPGSNHIPPGDFLGCDADWDKVFIAWPDTRNWMASDSKERVRVYVRTF